MKISLKPQKKLNKYKHQNLLYHQRKKIIISKIKKTKITFKKNKNFKI